MAFAAQDWITADLQLLEPLGTGSMGAVWMAWDKKSEAPVAIKILAPARSGLGRERVSRFKREAWAAAQIPSPHVARTFGIGETEDATPFIVMELLHGETLASRLAGGAMLSLADAALLLRQLADALGHAHARGIVHRDLKPENIWLEDGHDALFAKVLDFGVAKKTAAVLEDSFVTAAGVMVGTPDYMSPEQVFGSKDVDYRADLWGLAVVAYRSITGRLPFTRTSPHALCIAICRADYTPATAVRPDLPAALDPWFQRALQSRAHQRFPTAHEMAEAFVTAVAPNG